MFNFYFCEKNLHFQTLTLLICISVEFLQVYFEGLTIEVFMNEIGSEARSI